METPPDISRGFPEPRKLGTPTREDLMNRFTRVQNYCRTVLLFEAIVILFVAAWFIIKGSIPTDPLAWSAFGVGALGVFRWFLFAIYQNKKPIGEIRADAQFGVHTRDSLVRLAQETFEQAGVRAGSVPVYLTRGKDVNASAIRCELWPGQKFFNAVFLERSIIHLLDELELKSVIAHELGHAVHYANLLSRNYLVHSAFAGLTSLWIASIFPGGIGILAALGVLWILDRLIVKPRLDFARAEEFLCDDMGAQVAGVSATISTDMKLGAEMEAREKLLLGLLGPDNTTGNRAAALLEHYEDAIPFGKVNPEQFKAEAERLIKSKQAQAGKISAGGFLEFLGGSNDEGEEETKEEAAVKLAMLQAIPLIPIDRTPFLNGADQITPEAVRGLAASIENHPHQALFQSLHELDDSASTHPNTSRRILFIARNYLSPA